MCNKYQEVIVKAYLKIRRNRLRKERAAEKALLAAKKARDMEENEEDPLAESKGGDGGEQSKEVDDELGEEEEGEEEELTDWVLERWSFELANRRQYLAFLKSLQEEVRG